MDHWYYVIVPVVGIVVWGLFVVGGFGRRWAKPKDDPAMQRALEENAATNKALLAKLENIDTRLGAVEKTLNDIP